MQIYQFVIQSYDNEHENIELINCQHENNNLLIFIKYNIKIK